MSPGQRATSQTVWREPVPAHIRDIALAARNPKEVARGLGWDGASFDRAERLSAATVPTDHEFRLVARTHGLLTAAELDEYCRLINVMEAIEMGDHARAFAISLEKVKEVMMVASHHERGDVTAARAHVRSMTRARALDSYFLPGGVAISYETLTSVHAPSAYQDAAGFVHGKVSAFGMPIPAHAVAHAAPAAPAAIPPPYVAQLAAPDRG
jgi:hypothetical protein